MFERYTESARRLIFFARFEASRYGSPSIETEHLLLGLLREDRPLVTMFLGQGHIEEKIRAEVERQITHRERISTSVEMPLTTDCQTVLKLAAEEAGRLGHRHIETAHVLLGMLGVQGSLAFRLLQARGLKAAAVREKIAKGFRPTIPAIPGRGDGSPTLENFLSGLRSLNSEELIELFSLNAQFTDASGRCWNREEISEGFETLFAGYAKKNVAAVVEATLVDRDDLLVASVLWKNAILASEQRVWVHRMSIILIRENADWRILLMHITPVQPPQASE
jgi:hypothetical protein